MKLNPGSGALLTADQQTVQATSTEMGPTSIMDRFNTQSSESTDFTLKTTITDTELKRTVTVEQQFHNHKIIGVTTNDNIVTKQHIVYLLHNAVTLFAKDLQNTSIKSNTLQHDTETRSANYFRFSQGKTLEFSEQVLQMGYPLIKITLKVSL